MDELGQPIRAANLTHSWTFRGGPTREDIFRTMTTGLNGTPMPSFTEALTPEQRWAITDYIASLSGSDGPGYKNLVVAKHVLDTIDLAKGAANFAAAPVARFPIVGQIMEPGRAVPSSRDLRDGSGDLRRGVDRVPRSMERHESGQHGDGGPSLPVPIEEEEAKARCRTSGRRAAAAAADPFAETTTAEAPPSEFNDAVAIQIPSQVPTGARKPYFIFGDAPEPGRSLVLRSGPAPIPFSSPAAAARTSRPTTRAMSRASRATTRANGRSSSSGRFAQARARRSRPVSFCRSPSRSGTGSRASVATGEVSRPGTRSTSSRKWSHRPSARW